MRRWWPLVVFAAFLVACSAPQTTPTPHMPPGQGPPIGAPPGILAPLTPTTNPTIRTYAATRTAEVVTRTIGASYQRTVACDRLAQRYQQYGMTFPWQSDAEAIVTDLIALQGGPDKSGRLGAMRDEMIRQDAYICVGG